MSRSQRPRKRRQCIGDNSLESDLSCAARNHQETNWMTGGHQTSSDASQQREPWRDFPTGLYPQALDLPRPLSDESAHRKDHDKSAYKRGHDRSHSIVKRPSSTRLVWSSERFGACPRGKHGGSPYDAVGYIRRDGEVYDGDKVYRPYDPVNRNRVPLYGNHIPGTLVGGDVGSVVRGLSSKTSKNVSEKTEMDEQCSSTSPGSSGNNEQIRPKLPAATGDGKDKIHLQREENASISPQLDDDMEARTLRAVPAEDGMADPAVSVILNDAGLQYDLDMRRHQSEDISYRLHSASRRGEKYDDRYPRSSSYIDSLDLAGSVRVRRWLTEAGKYLGDAAHEKLHMTGGEVRPLVIDELAWNPTSSPLFPEVSDGNLRKLNPAGVSRTYIKPRDTSEVPKDARFSRSQSLRDNLSRSERHSAHSAFVITKAQRPMPATDQVVPPMLPYDVPPHLQPPDHDLEGSGDVNTVDDTNELVGDSNKNSVLKDGENISVLPSYAALVAPTSVESPSTSASGLPTSNSYAAAEIAEATKLSLLVLYKDAYHYLSTAIRSYLNPDALPHAIDHILVVIGLLEPALDQNKTRLRWQCYCGDLLYSDILEIREGGIAELVDNMEQSSGVKVHAAPYNHQAGNRQYIVPRPDRWLQNAATKVSSALERSWKSFSKCLPQHNEPCGTCATTPCASSNNLPPQQKTLHLSMCMDRTRRRKIVRQDRVDSFKTDRQLLCFLQKQYTAHSSRFPNLLRLKSVEKIVFVKYLLPMNGIVDVQRCNSTRPNQKYCYCIPPPKKVGVEYDYRPSPPKTHPPVSPEYLASWFTCMKDIPKVDKDQECWILNRLPKRTCGVLKGRKEDPAEGWGIYFVEGWDRATITLAIFVIFLVASLLFGVLWLKFQFDIQGGFGVSAYMGTVCTLLIAVVVTQLEDKV